MRIELDEIVTGRPGFDDVDAGQVFRTLKPNGGGGVWLKTSEASAVCIDHPSGYSPGDICDGEEFDSRGVEVEILGRLSVSSDEEKA